MKKMNQFSISKAWKNIAHHGLSCALFLMVPFLSMAQTDFNISTTQTEVSVQSEKQKEKIREVEKRQMEAFLGGNVQEIPYASDFNFEKEIDLRKKVGNYTELKPLSSNAALGESLKNSFKSKGIDELEIEATLGNVQWGAIYSVEDDKQILITVEPDPSPVLNDVGMAVYYQGINFTYYDDNLKPIKDFYVKMNDTTYMYSVVTQYSKSYFNYDDKIEFMFYAHSFGTGDGPAACRDTVIVVNEDGEVISRVGDAIGLGLHKVKGDFMDEKRVQVFNAYYHSLDDTIYSSVYNAFNFNENSTPLYTFRLPANRLTYSDGPYYDPINIDGEDYYMSSNYERTFIIGDDQENPVVDKTNKYHILLYNHDFELVKDFALPLPGIEENQFSMSNFANFGNYRITRHLFNNDDKYELLYGMSRYYTDCDCERLQLYIMDEDGNILEEILDGIAGIQRLQDLPGQDEEFAFLLGGGTSVSQIVMYDLLKRKENVRFDAIHKGDLLMASFERVASGDGDYQYVFGMARGETAGTTLYGGIGHYDRQGNLVKKVRIQLGGKTLFFEPILTAETLNPYSFIPDEKQEYLYFRRDQGPDGMSLESAFGIADEDTTLYMWQSDDEHGSLSGAGVRPNAERTMLRNLYVSYSGDEGYKTYFYKLPLKGVVLEGEGTKDSPYLIHNPSELDQVRNYPEAYFELANDIDMSSYTGVNASGFSAIPSFTGHFDGKNHFIKNMTLTGSGLFEKLDKGAVIQNLLIRDIAFRSIKGNTGVIVGSLEGASRVVNCHVEVEIESDVDLAYNYVGGLVGQAINGSIIDRCSFNGKMILPNVVQMGGIVGMLSLDSRLTNTVSYGQITGLNYVGGLVGLTQSGSLIRNSYSSMDVTGAMGIGGIIGSNQSRIENVYSNGVVKLEKLPKAIYVGKAAGIAGETAIGMSGTGFITRTFALNDTIMGEKELARVAYADAYTDWQGRKAMDSNYALSTMLLGADLESLEIVSDTNCALNRRNGLSGTLEDFNEEYYKKAGWSFGNDSISPWVFSGNRPRLWFEFLVRGIEFPSSKIVLAKGETYTLQPTVFPAEATDKSILYSSSDNSIASVNQDGVVKGIKPGTVEITALTVDGGYTAKCKVEVVIPVEQVIFAKDVVYVEYGGTYLLETTVLPEDATNKSLLYRSMDDNVALMYGATIAGVNLGETKVIAVSEDGGASDTCTVIVAMPTSAIYLNETSITLDGNNPSYQLEVSVYPSNSVHGDFLWSSRDESVATVSETGLVTAVGKGETVVDVKIEGSDISANCNVIVTGSVGNESMSESQLSVNTLDGNILVNSGATMRDIQLYGLNGYSVYTRVNLNAHSVQIPVNALSDGVYLLRIVWTDGSYRVVKVVR